LAPVLGVTVFLLFFLGTFLIVRGVDRNREDTSHGVAVGSCVTKGGDGRLIEANCASEGAQKITQIAEAGHYCDDPADIQHIFTTAGRPAICVSSGE